jgi:hypothetical protein
LRWGAKSTLSEGIRINSGGVRGFRVEMPVVFDASNSRRILTSPSSLIGTALTIIFMDKETFTAKANALRTAIKGIGEQLLEVKTQVFNHDVATGEDRGELLANFMLAYRHLEDASMRLGKCIQAKDGGTSVYDKESTMGATPTDSKGGADGQGAGSPGGAGA